MGISKITVGSAYSAPRWKGDRKVDPVGRPVAGCSDRLAAVALMAFYGAGAQVRNGHGKKNVVWVEGKESQSAADHPAFAAAAILECVTAAPHASTPE